MQPEEDGAKLENIQKSPASCLPTRATGFESRSDRSVLVMELRGESRSYRF